MTAFSRAARVAGQIQKVLSEILRVRVNDPRLSMITITGVKLSADLKFARIYFATGGGGEETVEAARQGFRQAHGFIKRILAQELGLRYMPELRYFYDESFDYGARIDSLLKSISDSDGSDHFTPEDE